MIYLYLFGTCFHFIYVFMIIGKYLFDVFFCIILRLTITAISTHVTVAISCITLTDVLIYVSLRCKASLSFQDSKFENYSCEQ